MGFSVQLDFKAYVWIATLFVFISVVTTSILISYIGIFCVETVLSLYFLLYSIILQLEEKKRQKAAEEERERREAAMWEERVRVQQEKEAREYEEEIRKKKEKEVKSELGKNISRPWCVFTKHK